MKKYLLIVLFLIASVVVKAQNIFCPPNIDVEFGNFTNWKCYNGAVGTSPPWTVSWTTLATPVQNRQTITPTGFNGLPLAAGTVPGYGFGLDPYGNFPVVCPWGNGFSARINSDTAFNTAAQLTYKFRLPSNVNSYALQFYYAAVLEDGGHSATEQPRFMILVSDSATGALISCDTINDVVGGTLPGYLASTKGFGVSYRPWTSKIISFKNLAGHTVVFTFSVGGCVFGGHFGYAYVDFGTACTTNVIVNGYCPGSPLASLIGPTGYQSYEWYDSTLTTKLDTNRIYVINPAPTDTTKYWVILHPYQGQGCIDTIFTYLTAQPKPIANYWSPNHYCANSFFGYRDSSLSLTPGTYIADWLWKFGDGDTSLHKNPMHSFDTLGTYTTCLIVHSSIACVSDTICQTIFVDKYPQPLQLHSVHDTMCAPFDTTTIWSSAPIATGSYVWDIDGGTLVNGSLNQPNPLLVKWTSTGWKKITLTYTPPLGVDSICWAQDTIMVYIKGIQPAIWLTGDDSICLHDVATINVASKPANCGSSITPCSSPIQFSTVGNGSGSTFTTPTVFNGFYTEARVQMLFTKAELNAAGLNGGAISEIMWNVLTKSSTQAYQGFTIKMACVPYSSLPLAPNGIDTTTPLTLVYSNSSYSTILGPNIFTLSTNYDWDGVSNLLVDVCFDNGVSNWTSDDVVSKTTMPSTGYCNWARSDTNPLTGCDKDYPGTSFVNASTDRPDITFKGCNASLLPTVAITWSANPAPFTTITYSRDSIQVSPIVSTTYTIVGSENGCDTKVAFFVDQMTKNTVNVASVSGNTTVCAGSSVSLLATGTGPAPLVPVPCSINTTGGCSGTPILTPKIGNGTVTSGATPFDYNYQNYRMLMRYSGASLTAAMGAGPKTITSFDWNITSKNSFIGFGNFTVTMQCVNSSWVFPSANFPSSGSVVRSPSNFTTVGGWNTINLTNSYNWDGVSDLLIEVCFSSAGFSSPDNVQGTTMASNCVLSAGNASAVLGCTIPSGAASNVLPNIRFKYCSINVNPSVLNYHWTSQRKSIPPGTPVDTNMISLTMMKTDTFIAHLMGTSIMPFCPVQDTIIITVTNLLATNKTNDTVVCPNTLLALHDTITSAGNRTVAWKWSTSDGRHLSCKTCQTPIDTVSSNHKIFVEVTSQFGCIQYDTINVYNPFIPTADFTTISPVCLNSNSTLTYTGTAGAGPYNFNWNFGGNSTPPSGLLTRGPLAVNWSTPGLKTITLTVDTIGCTSTFTNTVDVIPALSATFSLNKHIICAGDSVQLTYLGTSNSIPQVNFLATSVGSVIHTNNAGIAPVNLSYATAGKYYITLTVDYGATKMCQVTYTDSIIVNPIPTSTFTVNKTDICSGDNVLVTYTGSLNPSGGVPSYAWNFANPTSISNGTTNAYDTTLSWINTNSTVGIKNITLTVTQDGCISTQTLNTVKVHVIPVAKIDINFIATCSGPGSLTSLSSSGSIYENTPTANFIWTSSPLPTIPSSTSFSGLGQKGLFLVDYSNDTSLVKQYQMLQIIENGCTSNIAVDSIDVIPIPISSFRIIPDKVCSGTSATFEFNGVIDTACTNCTKGFKWTFDNPRLPLPSATNNGKKQSVIFDNQSGFNEGRTGTLEITDTRTYPNASNVVCKSKPYTAPVIVYPLPNITITGPQDICDKVTSYLSTSESYVRYQWSNGDTNDTIKVVNGGDYSVIVTDVNNCVNQATTHVTVHPIPVANAGEDQLIFVGNSAFLNASRSYGGDSYLWTPNRNIDAPTIISPVVSPTETTPYILTYYNSAVGCTDYDTVIINVRDCEPLVVPNAFTPNGDNIDDYFMVLNPNDYYRLVRLEIYNRWGELVYATNDKNNKGWDGQFRGVNQEVGTYIYHVTAECGGGKLMNIKGDVTLLR